MPHDYGNDQLMGYLDRESREIGRREDLIQRYAEDPFMYCKIGTDDNDPKNWKHRDDIPDEEFPDYGVEA